MKKHKFFQFLMIALIAGGLMTFPACSDDDDDDDIVVDKTELATLIQEAEGLIENTTEGTAEGQYQYGSQAALQEVIDLAKAVYDDENATQTEVDNVVIALDQAIQDYEAAKVVPIAPEALVGHWTFNEGEGTQVMDFSGNNFNGEFKTGHSHWGEGSPQWATDRYGNENQALYFNEGANVEIPFSTQLNPQEISISLWMKPDDLAEPWANNYMVSLNRWNGYKLQLQDSPKVFFTIKALHEGDPVWHDRDNVSPEINLGEWYHVAVTYKDGEMGFYLDGTQVHLWDNTPGTAIALDEPINLTIGQDLPTDVYTTDEGDFFVNWGGYFQGVLDDIRIYNTALSASQVESIYDLEKP